MRRIVELDEPASIDIQPIDLDDERSYIVTAVGANESGSLVLGPEQVAVLADRISAMVDELERRGLLAIDIVETDAATLAPTADVTFHAQTMLIGWDEEIDRLVVEAWSDTGDHGAGDSAYARSEADYDEINDDDLAGPDVVRIRLVPVMAQRFVRSALTVLAADRTTCPVCGKPMDASRHRCRPIEDAARED